MCVWSLRLTLSQPSPVLFQSPDCLGGRSGVCLAADLSPYWHGSPCLLPTAAVDATAAAVARSGYHGFLHRESPSADLNLDLDSHSSTRPSIPVIQSSSQSKHRASLALDLPPHIGQFTPPKEATDPPFVSSATGRSRCFARCGTVSRQESGQGLHSTYLDFFS